MNFFSGSHICKLDEKNRLVLPQEFRYALVEGGKLEFTLALGMGGCLAIYKKSDIDMIVEKFRSKQHIAKYQKFFTLFFSTLVHMTCDKVGRISIPSVLKKAVGIDDEVVIAGALSKLEIWPKAKYESDLQAFLSGSEESADFGSMMEEAFMLLDDSETVKDAEEVISGIVRV